MRVCKAILALSLALWLMLGMTAFGAVDSGERTADNPENEVFAPTEEAVEETTEEPTEDPTEEPTEESVEDPGETATEEPSEWDEDRMTTDEFLELLRENEGGSFALTGDVLWDKPYMPVEVTRPTTVQMGDHSFFSPESLLLRGPIRFIGSGEKNPLFTCEISFVAENAVVEATGSNGIAVEAADSTRIDGGSVSPMPKNAEIIKREAVLGFRVHENGISIKAGDDLGEALAGFLKQPIFHTEQPYYYLDVEREKEASVFVNYSPELAWENLPASTDAPGTYTIRAKPVNVPDWYPVELPAFDVTLYVVAENEPHIERVTRGFTPCEVIFFSEIPSGSDFTLFYSDDDGSSWHDFSELEAADVSPFGASTLSLEQDRVYLFRLEVETGPMQGVSNTVAFPYYWNDVDNEITDGDRTGADRFPSSPPENRPDETTGNDDGRGNGSSNNSSEDSSNDNSDNSNNDSNDDSNNDSNNDSDSDSNSDSDNDSDSDSNSDNGNDNNNDDNNSDNNDSDRDSSRKNRTVIASANKTEPPAPIIKKPLPPAEGQTAAPQKAQQNVIPQDAQPSPVGNKPLASQAHLAPPRKADPARQSPPLLPAQMGSPTLDQPALPEPFFPVAPVMAASGALLLPLVGAAVYLKRQKRDR